MAQANNNAWQMLGLTEGSDEEVLLDTYWTIASEDFLRLTRLDTLPDTSYRLIDRMAIYQYQRQGAEPLDSESYEGVSENYLTDYPEFILEQIYTYKTIKFI